MKRMYIYRIGMVIYLIGLSGCGHIIRWAEGNFYQGENMVPLTKIPQQAIRSVCIHNQFTIAATIEAMWLSDEVRTAYAEVYGIKNGKSDAMTKAFLRRQLEENKHFISFYVLTNFSLSIGDQNNKWAIFLQSGDAILSPNEIRVTELTPEFQIFFGKRFNRFKSIYLVKFNAKTAEGKPFITDTSQTMELYFRSIEKEAVLSWPVTGAPESADVAQEAEEVKEESNTEDVIA